MDAIAGLRDWRYPGLDATIGRAPFEAPMPSSSSALHAPRLPGCQE